MEFTNSQGVPNKDDFEKLHFMGKFAQSITSSDASIANKDFMPSFLWLVRDHMLQPRNQDGDRITMETYLQDVIKGEALTEFKDAFDMIREFSDFKVATLPPPHYRQARISWGPCLPNVKVFSSPTKAPQNALRVLPPGSQVLATRWV
jgi:hypothetical protein